jgi:tetratricopeptide (TPR) repeat protein
MTCLSRALIAALALTAWSAAAQRPPAPELEPPAAPAGALDPRAPVKPMDQALDELRADRSAAPALKAYEAGDYRRAVRLGRAALETDAGSSAALRYAVANSLAWSGRYDEALDDYRALLGTGYEARARAGIANVLLWQQRPDLAEREFRAALALDPATEDASKGLEFAGRELRPSATLRLSRTADNQGFTRDETWLSFRRWTDDRRRRYEIAVLEEDNRSPSFNEKRQALQGSAFFADKALAPRLEATLYDNKLFGTLQLEPVRDHVRLRAGRVNWGRLAFSAGALADRLTANMLGLTAEGRGGLGTLRIRAEGYDISDGNRVYEGEVQVTPSWQPLPARLEWSGGVFARRADHEDARYWSPNPAYELAYLGLRRAWYSDRNDITAWARLGAGVSETAKASYSAGLSARRWVAPEVALGLDAWFVNAPRPTPYRMHQFAASLQILW